MIASCEGCGVPLITTGLAPLRAECAFCLGKRLEREREYAKHTLPKCGICKGPIDPDKADARKGYWRVKGKLALQWLHAEPCYQLATKKSTFQSVNFREVRKQVELSTVKTWTQRLQERKDMAKLTPREMGRIPTFFTYFPKGKEGVGSFVFGKLLEARIIPAVPGDETRKFDKGAVTFESRIARGDTVDDVRVCVTDLSIAKVLIPLLNGSPGNPGLKGRYVGIVVDGVEGAKEYHRHSIFHSSDAKELVAEANLPDEPALAAARAAFGDDKFLFSYQTWVNGIETRYADWLAKQGKDSGIHPATGDDIPF